MKNEIEIHYVNVEEIIDMLKEYKEHQLYLLTDYSTIECTVDRLSYAESYVRAGDMIEHLKELLNERRLEKR